MAAPRGARPAPPSGSSSRLGPWLGGLAIVGVALAAYFATRDAPPPSARAPRPDLPGSGEIAAKPARSAAPRAPRADRKRSIVRPKAQAGAQPSAPPASPALDPRDVSDPALKRVLQARDDLSPGATQVLIDNLTSQDEVLVAEATRALVGRRATEAIAPLADISLEKAAGSGLSVINALGKLGQVAEGADKSAAVDRLLAMLREEKRRGARESPGNLLQIYEALGDTQDPRAAPALEAELLDQSVQRAPKVVIVQALVDVGLPSSEAALVTAHREQSAQQGTDALEEEIRLELVQALEEGMEYL